MHSLRRFIATASVCIAAVAFAVPASARMVVVPPGNAAKDQPEVDAGSRARTKETGGSFDGKFKRVYAMLERDPQLVNRIKRVAAIYGIDPIHVLGAIVAEHTYNVDAVDSAQAYYIKAAAYLGTSITFAYKGTPVTEFVTQPQFDDCKDAASDYDLWSCREAVWKASFRGKSVDGVRYPNDRFGRVFFQPLFAGQNFGLGQLSPLAALMVSDVVAAKGGLPKLDPDQAPAVYHAIMEPDTSLHYIAATIRLSIDAYKAAGFDISKNPGITATLYNIGDVRARANAIKAESRRGKAVMPRVNYFGWFVNEKQAELEKLL